MSPGSVRLSARQRGIDRGSRTVGERLHAAAHAKQLRRDSAAAAAAAAATPKRPHRRSPDHTIVWAPRLPSDPVGHERNARRQAATDGQAASSSSPRVRRETSTPRRVSPRVIEGAGSRLHQRATEAQQRRYAAQEDANAAVRLSASRQIHSPGRRKSVSSWESSERAYEEEDCVAALFHAKQLNAQRRSVDEEPIEKELRRQRFWAAIAEEERKLARQRAAVPQHTHRLAPARELELTPTPEPEPEPPRESECSEGHAATSTFDDGDSMSSSDCGSFASC